MTKVRLLAAVLAMLALGSCIAVGCGSEDDVVIGSDELDAGDATPGPAETPTATPSPRDAGKPPTDDEDQDGGLLDAGGDAEVVQDGGPATDGGECSGRANGFGFDAGDAGSQCCGQKLVTLGSPDHCGGCGIKCAAGMACEQPVPGEWGCRCISNAECRDAGYGTQATCFTLDAKGFCNCQCPMGAASCANVCSGGATCNDVPGQNFCGYP